MYATNAAKPVAPIINVATNLKELKTPITTTDKSPVIPKVLMDNSIEKFNKTMDASEIEGSIKRVFVQVDVSLSNSMIVAWWRQPLSQPFRSHQVGPSDRSPNFHAT